jgi:excinuclease UvrABC nuclease subunit
VKDAIELLNRRFHLRTCSRGFKTPASYGNPCLELDLHRCDGPCVGRAIADDYRAGVNAVLGLLDLDRDDVLQNIAAELEEASAALRFEQAQRIRRELDILTRLREEQETLASFALQEPCLIVQPAPRSDGAQILMIIEGRWWAQVIADSATEAAAAERLEAAWRRYVERGIEPIDHSGVDEANIIARWRKLDESQRYVVRIPNTADPNWLELVREAGRRLVNADVLADPGDIDLTEVVIVANDESGSGFDLA